MDFFPNGLEIRARQLVQLRALIREIAPGNKFYSDKLATAGITPGITSLEAFSRRMPLTTKQELVDDQNENPPYGSNLTYHLNRYTRFNQTSGTTGKLLRWLDTPETWDWMLYNWELVFAAAGVKRGDRVFFPFSFGPFLGFWTAFGAAARVGCLSIPGGGLSSVARLHAILENNVTVICCTPTYAMRLAEVAADESIDLGASHVKVIIVAGEPGGSVLSTRARIEQLWPGARVFDHHGMTEVGPVTLECPKKPATLHVIETSYYAEVIDPENEQHIEPGETGELVLTTLGRLGSPLLRYRTGDLVQPVWREPCDCGRCDMQLEGGILGRTDDMVQVRGVNIHPSAIERIVRSFEGVAEYRVEVSGERGMSELKILVEPLKGYECGETLANNIAKELRAIYALRVPVLEVEPGSLPRFELKARRWIRLPTT